MLGVARYGDPLEAYFALLWQPHGGGSLSATFRDVDAMTLPEIVRLLELTEQRRAAEAAAIKRARQPKK